MNGVVGGTMSNCSTCNWPRDLLPVVKGGMYYQAIGWGKKVCPECKGLFNDDGGPWPDSIREEALRHGKTGWKD